MEKVYGYVRVSTETQADKGYGLETQRNAIISYCKNNNLELVDIFEDKGISGAIGDMDDISKRKGLVKLLSILTSEIKIIVMNTSRLWRDENAKVVISKSIRKCESNIISIEQPKYSLYSKDPSDFIYNSMLEMLDQYERLQINMKLAKGRTTKAKKGFKPAGRTPYGYTFDMKDKTCVVVEEEASVVKSIYDMAMRGLQQIQIAAELNKHEIASPDKKQWRQTTIRNILSNDFYIGIVTHNKEKIIGMHEPIISKNDFVRLRVNKKYIPVA